MRHFILKRCAIILHLSRKEELKYLFHACCPGSFIVFGVLRFKILQIFFQPPTFFD